MKRNRERASFSGRGAGSPKKPEKSRRTGQSFLKGALILTLGTAAVKLAGALFKIPLANVIRENGMGYFGTAYQFYAVHYSLATAGFPVAISRMVAENVSLGRYQDVLRVRQTALPIFLATGTAGTLIMLLGSGEYSRAVGSPGAYLPILCLAPSIFFCCLSAIYRGYYQGLRNMIPTAVSGITEALGKLTVGLSGAVAAVNLLEREYELSGTVLGRQLSSDQAALSICSYAAAAAILGVTAGSLLSFLYLALYFRVRGDGITREMLRNSPAPRQRGKIAARLIRTALPIGMGSLAISLASLIDAAFLQRRLGTLLEENAGTLLELYRGMIPRENLADLNTVPNFLWGCYSNALTVFLLVPSLSSAFGVSALPGLTEAWTRGSRREIRREAESVLKLTCLVCLPAGLGITALAEPIARLIYGAGPGSQITARILLLLGLGSIFSALSTPLASMLQAMGKVDLPVKLLAAALALKVGLDYFLCGIPQVNVLGAGAGTLLCYLLVVAGELIALCRCMGERPDFTETTGKPLVSALGCVLGAWSVFRVLEKIGAPVSLSCPVAIAFAVPLYLILLLLTRSITKKDLILLPNGEKIAKLLEKTKWIG